MITPMVQFFRPRNKRVRRFPRCELHGTRIVDALPSGCPMRADRALPIIGAMQDAGYRELGRVDADVSRALAILDRAEICENCVVRLRRYSRGIQAA